MAATAYQPGIRKFSKIIFSVDYRDTIFLASYQNRKFAWVIISYIMKESFCSPFCPNTTGGTGGFLSTQLFVSGLEGIVHAGDTPKSTGGI